MLLIICLLLFVLPTLEDFRQWSFYNKQAIQRKTLQLVTN